MFNETTYSGILGALARFLAALVANISELPHLEASRARFEEILGRAQGLARQQAGGDAAPGRQAALRHPRGETRRVRDAAVPRQEGEDRARAGEVASPHRQLTARQPPI